MKVAENNLKVLPWAAERMELLCVDLSGRGVKPINHPSKDFEFAVDTKSLEFGRYKLESWPTNRLVKAFACTDCFVTRKSFCFYQAPIFSSLISFCEFLSLASPLLFSTKSYLKGHSYSQHHSPGSELLGMKVIRVLLTASPSTHYWVLLCSVHICWK